MSGENHAERVAAKPWAWLLAIAAPAAIYAYLTTQGVNREIVLFSAIVAIVLVLWMFSLVADFIPGLLAVLLILLFGLAPSEIVLSGFSSPGFLLAFSIMGLGAVVTSSGLTYRYTLILLSKLPANTFAHQAALFLTGFVLNPVVPTITGRAVIICPVLNEVARSWDEPTRRRSSTLLYTAGIDGINYLSPLFLTAAPANFLVFGLLPAQEQQAYQFLFWAYAAAVAGLAMLLLYFVLTALFFRDYHRVSMSKERIREDLKKLGPLSGSEHAALLGIVLLTIGIATASIHKIPIPYLTFAVLCSLLYLGVLSRNDFIQRIDWAFLVLLAGLIGVLATMNHLGINQILIDHLGWLGDYMRNDFPLFVLLLSLTILAVRILIPLNSAILIFAAALIPIADGAGVTPWVVGFIILVMAETAFFGYQSPYILFFRAQTAPEVAYRERKVQLFHGVLVLAKLAAIYLSIPFWKEIGVL
ncbi:SLC13 family permease [Endothiovibrio diazotrophicus]